MAISVLQTNSGGTPLYLDLFNTTTGGTFAMPSNVASGSLVSIQIACYHDSGGVNYTAGMLTKESGTATIASPTIDVQATHPTDAKLRVGIYSFLVTGSGSLTLRFNPATGTTGYATIGVLEASGTWTSSRLDGTPATGTSDSSTAATTSSITSAGAALFVGGYADNAGSAITITQDAAFTLVMEDQSDASAHQRGASAYRSVGSSTNDAASWTLSSAVAYAAALAVYKEDAGSPPTAPTAGAASSVTPETATANWTDNSSDETGFKVETSPDPYSSWSSQGTAAANATSRALTGLTPGTAYKFRVAATNGSGDSSWATSAVFNTPAWSYVRPISDLSEGWSLSSGTDSWDLLNETSASDADYIYATAAGQTTELLLGPMSVPVTGTSFEVRYRIQGIAAGATVTVSLRQGASTVIKTDTTRTANGDYTMTVSSADWDTEVTDWTDLRLRFVSG